MGLNKSALNTQYNGHLSKSSGLIVIFMIIKGIKTGDLATF